MVWNVVGLGELLEQVLYVVLVVFDCGEQFGVGVFQVGVSDQVWVVVFGFDDIDYVKIVLNDQLVEVNVKEIEVCCCFLMSQEVWFDVFYSQWFFEEWIVVQIDLVD